MQKKEKSGGRGGGPECVAPVPFEHERTLATHLFVELRMSPLDMAAIDTAKLVNRFGQAIRKMQKRNKPGMVVAVAIPNAMVKAGTCCNDGLQTA